MNRSYYKNAKPDTVLVTVDANGVGLGGETFAVRANPQHVLDDLVWEMPVVLAHYGEDGSLPVYSMGTRLVVTSAGLAAGIQ